MKTLACLSNASVLGLASSGAHFTGAVVTDTRSRTQNTTMSGKRKRLCFAQEGLQIRGNAGSDRQTEIVRILRAFYG